MEFITTFCIILALGFILWFLGIAALFLIKLAVGTTGAIYFGVKKMVEGLQRVLFSPFSGSPIGDRPDNIGEQNAALSEGPVNVSFNSDNSMYCLKKDGVWLESVKRFTDNNAIFSCYLTASGFKADINNLRLGERRTVEAKNAEEMKCTMEGWFQKWMAEDPGGHFTYSDP